MHPVSVTSDVYMCGCILILFVMFVCLCLFVLFAFYFCLLPSRWIQLFKVMTATAHSRRARHIQSYIRHRAHMWPNLIHAAFGPQTATRANGTVNEGKFSHTRYRALGPGLIRVHRQSGRRCIHLAVGCHYFPPARVCSTLKYSSMGCTPGQSMLSTIAFYRVWFEVDQ